MSVTLRRRKNADGSESLRLDIYHAGKRTIETLKNLKLVKVSNPADREKNKGILKQAEVIRTARAGELEANSYYMVSDAGKKTIVAEWMQSYIDKYQKKDKRILQGALNRFSDFLKEAKMTGLTFGNLNEVIIVDFISYLESKSVGEGASSYFKRFKKMVKYAFKTKLMKEDILQFIDRKVAGRAKRKDILTLDELSILSATPTDGPEVKRAFLFCCMTGLRWTDVKSLKWENVNLKDRSITLVQNKTGDSLYINLNDTAISLLGKSSEQTADLVFKLPTPAGANKTIRLLIKRANIHKRISWHCARHSFGTNLILSDIPILTASKLLGHSSLKHTQRYVDTARELKEKAVDTLNFKLSS